MTHPAIRPVIESKLGFERGQKKPHVCMRGGNWHAFMKNPKEAPKFIHNAYRWAFAPKWMGDGHFVLQQRFNQSGNFGYCSLKLIQARGLLS
jgi:hypothetical protein